MSLLDIAEAANDLAALLEATAPRGLRHPRHAQHVAPARAKINAVMAHYFERQRKAVLAAVKPHIDRQLMLHPRPIQAKEADEGEWRMIHGHPVLLGGGEEANRDRVERAKKSQVVTGKKSQDIAERSEIVLAKALGIPKSGDNLAFDVRNDDVAIEVKTLVNGKNEKITMGKTALGRKLAEQRAEGLKAYTVVVDRRQGGMTGHATYYYREGLGSFRLGSMTKVSLGELKRIVNP